MNDNFVKLYSYKHQLKTYERTGNKVENIVLKGEIAHNEHFFRFTTIMQTLQEASICGKGLSSMI